MSQRENPLKRLLQAFSGDDAVWTRRRFWLIVGGGAGILWLASFVVWPRLALPLFSLLCGLLFFLYGLRYYASVAHIMLASSGGVNGNGNGNGHRNGDGNGNGNGNGLRGMFKRGNGNGRGNGNRIQRLASLQRGNGHHLHGPANGGNGKKFRIPPDRQPFISIQLPLYNEDQVVDRLLKACTNLDYQNYEVLVADDSSDHTLSRVERWAKHPKVRVSHRINRAGFKGAALKHAAEVMNPKSSFVVVFDADFIPPPDILHQFLAYFYGLDGSNGKGNGSGNGSNGDLTLVDEKLAVVQGYQWHVLNASENWITRGIRAEFAGSYVIERSWQELTGGMKMISGSVFMIRADVLRQHRWGTSITEDWELTLRLYIDGYRVLYTPFIQAPAECVSDFKQLTRQRMRWAEGHTHNVKRYFFPVLRSPNLTRREKLEFLYYAPYYLTSVMFIAGTAAWMISELFLRIRLPFWSDVLGWSLVFTNAFSLILMNLAGLFQERGIRRSWVGLLSFTLLTFLLVPYQGYAAVKGLLEPHEGGWHRTDKTGVITDVIDRLGMGKRMRKLAPKRREKKTIDLGKRLGPPVARVLQRVPVPLQQIARRASPRLGFISMLIIGAAFLWLLTLSVPLASATPAVSYLRDTTTNGANPSGKDMNDGKGSSEDLQIFDSLDDGARWYSEVAYPDAGGKAAISSGEYAMELYFSQLPTVAAPQVDAKPQTGVTNRGSSITIPHTVSGQDRLMLVGVSLSPEGDEYVESVTWKGTEELSRGDRVAANGEDARVEIWTLLAPSTGPGKVVVIFNAPLAAQAVAGVMTFTGVDQNDPLGTFASSLGDDPEAISLKVASDANELVFGVVAMQHRPTRVQSGQTAQWSQRVSGSSTYGAGTTRAGAAPVVEIAWSYNSARKSQWAIGGVSIKPATPAVDIRAAVYHTETNGTSPQLIVRGSTTVDPSTTNPFDFVIGSGAGQPFTSADPRRLQVHLEVAGIRSGGSFTLAYDSSASPTALHTPSRSIAGANLPLLASVIFIPMLTATLSRKRRLAIRLISVILAILVSMSLLAQQVMVVGAAPDVFYLRDTTNNGESPAGEDMNTALGSSEDSRLFDDTGDDLYWYTELAYPTGDDDATIAAGNYTFNMYFKDIVTTGSCTISNGSSSQNCAIDPVLSDTTKTFMIFQATSSNNEPNNSSVRCYITSTSNITCDRNGTTGTVNIAWQTAEFPKGVTVQHLTPVCNVDGDGDPDITNVSITAVADMTETFVLYSHRTSGSTYDSNDPRTVRLTSTTNVEIHQSGFASCAAGSEGALQVVEFDNASVTRGVTSAMTGLSLGVGSLGSVTLSRTMLLYSYRYSGGGAVMCDRMVRGEMDTATSLSFTRGDGNSSCDTTNDINAIAWERVQFPTGTSVQQKEPSMAASTGSTTVGITSIDQGRSLIFAGGQHTTGQSIGEGSYTGDDVIGAMVGRHTFTANDVMQVVRDDTNGTARWTSYVVQFPVTYDSVSVDLDVYHVGPVAGDTLIVSTSTTIDTSTTNPNAVTIGSGAAQNYTSSDRRRLRLFVDVTGVTGNGAFQLAYDSSANPSALETPGMTIPELGLAFLMLVPMVPYLMSLVWRRKRLLGSLISVLLASCAALAVLATHVPRVSAAPNFAVDNSTTFWFYDDTTPQQYMMYQTQPSGTSQSAGNTTIYFYSDTWPDTWSVNAGTTTVYFYVATTGNKTVSFDLQAGSGASWTSLGTGQWSGNPSTITLVSTSFSNSSYTFSTGEQLRLQVSISNNAYFYWDGSYNNSRLVVPGITVPEAAIALIALVLLIPALTNRLVRRKTRLFAGGKPARKEEQS